MEGRDGAEGMRVNMIRTKLLISGAALDVMKDSGKFPLQVRNIVYNTYVRSALLHGSETWAHSAGLAVTATHRQSDDSKNMQCPNNGQDAHC